MTARKDEHSAPTASTLERLAEEIKRRRTEEPLCDEAEEELDRNVYAPSRVKCEGSGWPTPVRGWSIGQAFESSWNDIRRGGVPAVLALGLVPSAWTVPIDYLLPGDLMSYALLGLPWFWPLIPRCGETAIAIDVARGGTVSFRRFASALKYLLPLTAFTGWPILTAAIWAASGVGELGGSNRAIIITVGCVAVLVLFAAFRLSVASYAMIGSSRTAIEAARFSWDHVGRNWPMFLGVVVVHGLVFIPSGLVMIPLMLIDDVHPAAHTGAAVLVTALPHALMRLVWAHALLAVENAASGQSPDSG